METPIPAISNLRQVSNASSLENGENTSSGDPNLGNQQGPIAGSDPKSAQELSSDQKAVPTQVAVLDPPTHPKIEAKNIDFFYGNTQALNHISIAIPAHAVTAFIGPSGCGKSTFLRCINRMNDEIPGTKMTGTLLLDNEDIYASGMHPIELRSKVGMVFQKPFPFQMSIFENVAFGLRRQGLRNKSALEDKVEKSLIGSALWNEVKDKLHQSAYSLSGGQQQRLCIARALAVEPEVILMDEPCSALDPGATSRIEDLIGELKRSVTIVIVTHNMNQAQRASDLTAFFLHGNLIEYNKTSSLFLNPKAKETEDYISGRFG